MSNLTPLIKSIQDIMRQDSGVDGDAQRISQLTWLLFLKVFDALEEELELTRDDYKSPLPDALRWRNWAADPEGITGDALLNFVNNELFPTLKNLPGDAQRNPRGYVVRGMFAPALVQHHLRGRRGDVMTGRRRNGWRCKPESKDKNQ